MAGQREPAGLTASPAIVVDHVLSRREGTRRRAPSIRVAVGACAATATWAGISRRQRPGGWSRTTGDAQRHQPTRRILVMICGLMAIT